MTKLATKNGGEFHYMDDGGSVSSLITKYYAHFSKKRDLTKARWIQY